MENAEIEKAECPICGDSAVEYQTVDGKTTECLNDECASVTIPEVVQEIENQADTPGVTITIYDSGETQLQEFSARISGNMLFDLIQKLLPLVDEARLEIFSDRIHIRAVDPSHVAMLDYTLSDQYFEEYHYHADIKKFAENDSEIPSKIGVDVAKINRFLKSLGAKAKKELFDIILDVEAQKMILCAGDLRYTFGLISQKEMSAPKIPNLNLCYELEITDSREIVKGIRAFSTVCDFLKIETDGGNTVKVSCEGDTDNASFLIYGVVRQSNPANSKFPTEYMAKILKSMRSEEITLKMGNDYPIRLESRKGQTIFLLAPRIESSD